MKIGIIGAGVSGLTIGYRLAQSGHSVTIYESAREPGGLASGFKEDHWDWPLERHYHHLFTSDTAIQNLAAELGVPIDFYSPQTSVWYNHHSYPFDSPLSILKFPHLSVAAKARLSFWLAYLKFNPYYKNLENQLARDWIIKHMGQEVWQVVWKPLFHGKFGGLTDHISAVWFWSRIYKRSPKLGYFQGGYQAFTDALTQAFKNLGGQLHLSTPVDTVQLEKNNQLSVAVSQSVSQPPRLNHQKPRRFDRVIIAGPSSLLLKLVPDLPRAYLQQLTHLQGIGAVNLVLALNQQFLTDNTYWLNINDEKIPFLAVVEHTNMIDPSHYGGDRLLYVGNYLPANHQYFQLSDQQLITLFTPHLQNINPNFDQNWIKKSWIFKAPFAQHIVTPHYRDILPSIQTPVPNLYWVSMQHVYPWDRGTNYSVEWGEKVAKMIIKSAQG
jgi:protoporphyrinogen oxidase